MIVCVRQAQADLIFSFLLFKVIKGIVDGCRQSDCALLGGEVLDFLFLNFLTFYLLGVLHLIYCVVI